MLATVKLYNNPFVKGNEINNIFFNRLLPSELGAFKLAVSQVTPQIAFRISTLVAQFSGKCVKGMSLFHGSFPHPLTPSRKGRGDL